MVDEKELIFLKNIYAYFLGLLLLANFTKNETHSLYKRSDPVVQITNDTILDRLSGSDKVWIIEFYSSWCGHCQSFAPKWVRLAYELKNWHKYVNVGALNCAAERNLDTCSKTFKIERYPTIRFYNVDWQEPKGDAKNISGRMGFEYKGKSDITLIRRSLVDHIEKQDNPIFNKINFDYITDSTVENFLYTRRRSTYRYLALVFEDPDSYTGKLLMLDASDCKKMAIRRVSKFNQEMTSKYKVAIFPSLILVTLVDGEFKELSSNNRTHESFVKALNEITKIVEEPPKYIKDDKSEKLDEMQRETVVNRTSDVYMVDILSSISFSLRREIPKKDELKGDAFVALKNYVNLLMECAPAEKPLASFLSRLDDWLKPQGAVKTAKYVEYLEQHQEWDSYLPAKIEFHACQGSKKRYRGFPCSLWVLFHALTVNCAAKQPSSISGLEVLKRLRGFIDHFFGCRYCRDHFVDMAKHLTTEVSTYDEAILWLWEKHNKVNARLRTAVSSDPVFPKIQFPPDSMCEECRKPTLVDNTIETDPGHDVASTKWNKRVVLEFLKDHYGPDNIRIKESHKRGEVYHDENLVRFNSSPDSFAFIGLYNMDMSLCVALYITAMLSLILLYLYFIKRRTKKLWKHLV